MNISNTSFTPANIIFAHAAEAASRVILGESLENIFILAMRCEFQCGTSCSTRSLHRLICRPMDNNSLRCIVTKFQGLLDSECS